MRTRLQEKKVLFRSVVPYYQSVSYKYSQDLKMESQRPLLYRCSCDSRKRWGFLTTIQNTDIALHGMTTSSRAVSCKHWRRIRVIVNSQKGHIARNEALCSIHSKHLVPHIANIIQPYGIVVS